jgi:hypothetical protein
MGYDPSLTPISPKQSRWKLQLMRGTPYEI